MAALQPEGTNDDEKTGLSTDVLTLPQQLTSPSFDTEVNILTKQNMNLFSFTGYPHQNVGGSDPKYICDQINRQIATDWNKYGYQTHQDSNGVAYIQIDLKQAHYVTKWAVSGYPGGTVRIQGTRM